MRGTAREAANGSAQTVSVSGSWRGARLVDVGVSLLERLGRGLGLGLGAVELSSRIRLLLGTDEAGDTSSPAVSGACPGHPRQRLTDTSTTTELHVRRRPRSSSEGQRRERAASYARPGRDACAASRYIVVHARSPGPQNSSARVHLRHVRAGRSDHVDAASSVDLRGVDGSVCGGDRDLHGGARTWSRVAREARGPSAQAAPHLRQPRAWRRGLRRRHPGAR